MLLKCNLNRESRSHTMRGFKRVWPCIYSHNTDETGTCNVRIPVSHVKHIRCCLEWRIRHINLVMDQHSLEKIASIRNVKFIAMSKDCLLEWVLRYQNSYLCWAQWLSSIFISEVWTVKHLSGSHVGIFPVYMLWNIYHYLHCHIGVFIMSSTQDLMEFGIWNV